MATANNDQDNYNMGHKHRGIAVIFDNFSFDNSADYQTLDGHLEDVRNYKLTFKKIGFKENEIQILSNKTASQMVQIMKEYAEIDYNDYDCFMAVFLSHGYKENKENYIMGKDKGVLFEDLVYNFKYPQKENNLKGKPKIFFIDACRGIKDYPKSNKSNPTSADDEKYEIEKKFSIDTNSLIDFSDFFFGYATVDDYKAKHNSKGSCYSKVVCETINDHFERKHLLEIDTIVKHKLKENNKPTPESTATLTKLCYFRQISADNTVQNKINQTGLTDGATGLDHERTKSAVVQDRYFSDKPPDKTPHSTSAISAIRMPVSKIQNLDPNFIDRENFLKEIREAFGEKKITALSAAAGTGKTELAIKYGQEFLTKNQFNLVYYMQSSGNKLDWEFKDFADQLQVHLNPSVYENKNSTQFKQGLISRISTIINSSEYRILFIFDNCDNYDCAAIYINQLKLVKNTAILLTTRDPEFCKNLKNECRIVKLEPFNKNESFEYLKLVMNDQTESNNSDTLEKVLYLIKFEKIRPYYLKKFVSFVLLKVGHTSTLSKFINEFRNNREDLMNMLYNDSDNTIFKMMNENENSFILIKYAAFLDPDFIPVDIFTEVFSIEKCDLENYINVLLKLSLISVEERQVTSAIRIESNNLQNETETLKGIKIHRTLKNETEQYLNYTKEYFQILGNLTIKFHKALKEKSNFLKNKYFYYNFRELAEKSLSLADLKCFIDLTNETLIYLFEIYLSFGFYILRKDFMPNDECLKYFEKVLLHLQKKEALKTDESLIYVRTLYYYGMINSIFEKKDDALKYLEQALTILETLDKESLYKESSQFLNSSILESIGSVYSSKMEYNRSIEYHLKSLLIKKESKNIDTQNIVDSMKSIGQVYNFLDNNIEAIKYFDDALKIQRDLYKSDDNEHIAETLHQYANILNSDGVRDYKKAIDFYEKSLEFYLKNKTDQKFMIINILNSIGLANFNVKNYTKSLEYLNRSLNLRLDIYQSYEDSGIAMTLNNIGMVKNHLNENKEALETFNKSLSIIKKIYSEDNMNVANIYNNIGMVFCDFGDYKEALNYLEKALTIKQSKNNKSLTVANTLNNIGIVYSLSEQDDKAINFFEQSLEIKNNLFSDSHLNVNQTKENLKIINQKINSSVFQKFLLFFYKKFFPYNYGYEKSLEYIWSNHVCFD